MPDVSILEYRRQPSRGTRGHKRAMPNRERGFMVCYPAWRLYTLGCSQKKRPDESLA